MIDLSINPFYLKEEGINWVKDTLNTMSIEEKVGQLFCVLFKELDDKERDNILKTLYPGACMYRANTTEKTIRMSNCLQKKVKVPLLIAANLEKGGNGIVKEGTLFGAPLEVAATNDVVMAEKMAIICAKEGKAVGANWSFAPIIDIDSNFRNPITNCRTFGSQIDLIESMSLAYTRGVQKLNIAASAKHFPGDGQDERDQHLTTTINDMTCEQWDESYGRLYKKQIDAGVLTCMMGHIMLPSYSRKLNPDIEDQDILPASLSFELMQGLLREQLGFNGLIVTDATTMAGFMIPMDRKQAVPYSVAAGADMFLFARNLDEDYQYMLDGVNENIITSERLDEAVTRILATKAALGLHKGIKQLAYGEAANIIGSEQHLEWSRECADKSITLVKEEQGTLPLSLDKYQKILFYPVESPGGESIYATIPVCNKVKEQLEREGFEVEVFEPYGGSEGRTKRYDEVLLKYDLILYVANLATKSNQTTVRIEWQQPMGANCPHYINVVPSIFISLENPYHLLDVPRIKTFINTYNSNDRVISELIEKLMGRSAFKGKNPVDPFCGRWDTRL